MKSLKTSNRNDTAKKISQKKKKNLIHSKVFSQRENRIFQDWITFFMMPKKKSALNEPDENRIYKTKWQKKFDLINNFVSYIPSLNIFLFIFFNFFLLVKYFTCKLSVSNRASKLKKKYEETISSEERLIKNFTKILHWKKTNTNISKKVNCTRCFILFLLFFEFVLWKAKKDKK